MTKEKRGMLSYQAFETIVWKYSSSMKKSEERIFAKKEDLTRALLSLPESVTVSSFIRTLSTSSINNNRNRGINSDIVNTFLRRKESDIAQNYELSIGNYFTFEETCAMAEDFIALIRESGDLPDGFEERCLAIKNKKDYSLLFAALLKQAIITSAYNREALEEIATTKRADAIVTRKQTHHLQTVSPWFTGRKKQLKEIAEAYNLGHHVIIITAPGGYGKTQLSRRFANDNDSDYSDIFWVDCYDATMEVVDQYADFLQESGVDARRDSKNVIQHLFENFLKERNKWLIVYDNVDFADNEKFNQFRQLLPQNLENGNVLITTRAYRQLPGAYRINLDTFIEEKDDAANFIMNRSGDRNEKDAIQLAERLGYHPLAMEIAAAYIAAVPNFSIESYNKLLSSDFALLDESPEIADYSNNLSQIINTTINRIGIENGESIADYVKTTLSLFSLLPANQVDPSVLNHLHFFPDPDVITWSADDDKAAYLVFFREIERLRNFLRSEINQNKLIFILLRYALITDNGQGFFSMHELVQELLYRRIGNNHLREMILSVLTTIYSGRKQGESEETKLQRLLMKRDIAEKQIEVYTGFYTSTADNGSDDSQFIDLKRRWHVLTGEYATAKLLLLIKKDPENEKSEERSGAFVTALNAIKDLDRFDQEYSNHIDPGSAGLRALSVIFGCEQILREELAWQNYPSVFTLIEFMASVLDRTIDNYDLDATFDSCSFLKYATLALASAMQFGAYEPTIIPRLTSFEQLLSVISAVHPEDQDRCEDAQKAYEAYKQNNVDLLPSHLKGFTPGIVFILSSSIPTWAIEEAIKNGSAYQLPKPIRNTPYGITSALRSSMKREYRQDDNGMIIKFYES